MTVASELVTIAAIPSAAGGGYVVDGSTILQGEVATVNGSPVSVAVGGSDIVVGKSTLLVGGPVATTVTATTATAATATDPGLGGVILSLFNGPGQQSTGAGAATSTAVSKGNSTQVVFLFEGSATTGRETLRGWEVSVAVLGSILYASSGWE